MNKHEFSVIGIASHLASVAIGTSEAEISDSQYEEWLKWRVTECWSESCLAKSLKYDESVKAMAINALELYEAR